MRCSSKGGFEKMRCATEVRVISHIWLVPCTVPKIGGRDKVPASKHEYKKRGETRCRSPLSRRAAGPQPPPPGAARCTAGQLALAPTSQGPYCQGPRAQCCSGAAASLGGCCAVRTQAAAVIAPSSPAQR